MKFGMNETVGETYISENCVPKMSISEHASPF